MAELRVARELKHPKSGKGGRRFKRLIFQILGLSCRLHIQEMLDNH